MKFPSSPQFEIAPSCNMQILFSAGREITRLFVRVYPDDTEWAVSEIDCEAIRGDTTSERLDIKPQPPPCILP